MLGLYHLNIFLIKNANTILRMSIGLIYVWFGLLKVLDLGPIDALVDRTIQFLPIKNFSNFLGFWEVLIGVLFFTRKFLMIGIVLFFLQIPGTFLPLFLFPEVCFVHFPFVLSLEGQYIFKNFILIGSVIQVYVNHLKTKS